MFRWDLQHRIDRREAHPHCGVSGASGDQAPAQRQTFPEMIEAKLNVLPFDEESARKKLERALAAGRNVGADVEATGVVWTYATTPESEQEP